MTEVTIYGGGNYFRPLSQRLGKNCESLIGDVFKDPNSSRGEVGFRSTRN